LATITVRISGQNSVWANSFGDIQSDKGTVLTHDSKGNIYVSGVFSSTVDFDPGAAIRTLTSVGNSNIFLAKYDTLGNYVWAKRFGNGGTQFGSLIESSDGITVDSSGIYLTGKFRGTVDFDPSPGGTYNLTSGGLYWSLYVTKFDFSGNFIWAKRAQGSSTQIYPESISADLKGNVLITGRYNFGVSFDPAPGGSLSGNELGTVFILKLKDNGDFKWAKSVDGHYSAINSGFGVVSDNSSNVYTIGHYRNIADFDPGPALNNIASNNNSEDVFILKLDSLGNFLWVKSFGSAFSDFGQSIAIHGNYLYLTGSYQGSISFDSIAYQSNGMDDIFITKISSLNGDVHWSKSIGGNSIDNSASIKVGSSGVVFTTGAYRETVDFNPSSLTNELTSYNGTTDVYILALDSLGNFEWVTGFGGQGTEISNEIALDNLNGLSLTGFFSDSVDFDPSVVVDVKVSKGVEDVFVTKFKYNTIGLSSIENSGKSFEVFPNPSGGVVYFKTEDLNNLRTIEIYDRLGRKVKELSNSNLESCLIDLNGFPKGLYQAHFIFSNTQSILSILVN
jgi:hypothetical protein